MQDLYDNWQFKFDYKSLFHINNSLHLALKYARVFIRVHYLFREHSSRKTVSFAEQIMAEFISGTNDPSETNYISETGHSSA